MYIYTIITGGDLRLKSDIYIHICTCIYIYAYKYIYICIYNNRGRLTREIRCALRLLQWWHIPAKEPYISTKEPYISL